MVLVCLLSRLLTQPPSDVSYDAQNEWISRGLRAAPLFISAAVKFM